MLSGFRQFILRGNVVDLAVAVVVGAAFSGVVSSLTGDFINPLIALFGGKPNLTFIYFTVHGSKFLVGDFLNNLIAFLIDALVIYFFVVLPINKLIIIAASRKPANPADKKCPFCFSNIPLEAKKCAFCTSEVPALKGKDS
jgi:large conductance mechanosensitive channel